MKKKGVQNEVLLTICNEIAGIKSKEDMLQFIGNTLKQYLLFDDSQILVFNSTNRTCKPFIYDSQKDVYQDPDFRKYLDREYAVADESVEFFLEPTVYNVASLVPGGTEQIHFMHSRGVKEFVVVKLIVGVQFIGLLVLMTEMDNSFQEGDLDLLQKISFQIAIATANIIAAEQMARNEEEKASLLEFSHMIASVRNKNELLELLNSNLKRLFPIAGFGITLQDEDGKTHSPFVVDVKEQLKNADFKAAINQSYSTKDGVYDMIIDSDSPVSLLVDDLPILMEKCAYVEFWRKMGIKKVIGTGLKLGEKNLGCFILLQDNFSDIIINANLLKGLSAQLSVAISNINANEEIIERQAKQFTLLSITQEIAVLRNRNDLFHEVIRKFKELFLINEFGIGYINNNDQTYSSFTIDKTTAITSHEDFNSITSAKYSIHDTLFSKVMSSEEPVYFDVDKLSKQIGAPPYVTFWKAVGFQKVLCVALRVSRKNIGCAFIHIDNNPSIHKQIDLVKGVCAQLSVAISNILAQEEIESREMEREFLLSLNMAIAAVRNNEDLLVIITERLKKILPFTHAQLIKVNEDGSTATPYLFDPASISKNHPKYKDLKGSKYSIHDRLLSKCLETSDPTIAQLEQLEQEQVLPLYAQINLESGIKQIITTRLLKGNQIFGFWMMFFNKEIILDSSTASLIKGISDQISIALYNIIANDEIQIREKEKSYLLDFSNALISTKDKVELGNIITQQFIKLLETSGHYIIYALGTDRKTYYPILFDAGVALSNPSNNPPSENLNDRNNVLNESVFKKNYQPRSAIVVGY